MRGFTGGLQSGFVTTIVLILFLVFGVTVVKQEKKKDADGILEPPPKQADISKKEQQQDPCPMKTNTPTIETDHVKSKNQEENAHTTIIVQDPSNSKQRPEFQPQVVEDGNTDTIFSNDLAKVIGSEKSGAGMANEGNLKGLCSAVTQGLHSSNSDATSE
ncbi:MAG: hypothetical protein MCM46_15965 [Candidatus Manganitrophus sp. SB1]|nr:hypothetical protein [Candidatus Manganitrophus morganii]